MSTWRPIIFGSENVNHILDGKKQETRRTLKPQPVLTKMDKPISPIWSEVYTWKQFFYSWNSRSTPPKAMLDSCPYGQPGDMLWVKETWLLNASGDPLYRADFDRNSEISEGMGWKSPMFMPRKLSRLSLKVRYICVQQLRDMTQLEAQLEGASISGGSKDYLFDYERIWNTVNKKPEDKFNFKTWVWVVGFEVESNALRL